MSPVFGNTDDKVEFLARCPAFDRFTKSYLRPLARAMKEVPYPSRDRLDPPDRPFGQRPFRVLVTGRVAVSLFTGGLEVLRMLARPGGLLSTESVAAWRNFDPRYRSYGAEVVDPCLVLELSPDRFRDVFEADRVPESASGPTSLLDAVLSAHRMLQAGPLLADIVRHSPALRYVRRDLALQGLMAGGYARHAKDEEEVIERGRPPGKFVILLEGRLHRIGGSRKEPRRRRQYHPGAVIGLQHVFAGTEAKHSAVADGEPLLLEVDEERLLRGMQVMPRLAAAVHASLGKVPLFEPNEKHKKISIAQVTLILNGARQQPPMARWVVRLGLYIHRDFEDEVAVIQLIPESGGRRSTTHPHGVRIHRIPLSGFDRDFLDSLVGDYGTGDEACVVLVDPSELPSDERFGASLFEACDRLEVPVRAAVVVDHPDDWREVLRRLPLAQRRWALGVPVLEAVAIDKDVGNASSPTRDPAPQDAPSWLNLFLAPGNPWASFFGSKQIDYAKLGRPPRPDRPGDLLVENLLGEPTKGDYWMAGGVRMVLPAQELRPDAGAEPLDDLAQDPSNVRESFGRWSRAVTYRRVGLAIGGAAALGNSAIPLLRGLRARDVPVDIISGTSYGTLVGSFYIVHGCDDGLELLLDRAGELRPLLLSTGSVTSRGIEMWMRLFVGTLQLDQLPIPLIPVATVASEFSEWDIRGGGVAVAVRASCSMPPGAPTYRDGRRSLDGALIANVPCRVLEEEDADLIFGASSFPKVEELAPHDARDPLTVGFESALPYYRYRDAERHFYMLHHFASSNQRNHAHAYYTASNAGFDGFDLHKAREIARSAEGSDALCRALDEMEQEWERVKEPDI